MLLGVEGGLAQSAVVDLLGEVRHLVQLQDVVVAEGLATDIAAVGLFFVVSPVVDLELLTTAEPFVADATNVGSLTGVRPHHPYTSTTTEMTNHNSDHFLFDYFM